MRKILSFTLTILILSALFVQGGKRTLSPEESAPPKELVDIKADVVFPHKLGPDSSVICLVGNFAAHHNGAVITADSAVRYGDERLDCFGNVLINKNTTYAYADRAVYNGTTNQITLYSPIIKVVDEGITLYTYNFSFNTLDNVGTYWGGGVITNTDSSRLESLKGFYYSDLKEVVGVGDVEVYTTDYELMGDSVRYNMESDHARFFENTNIWNTKGEYLYTDEGSYDKQTDCFSFTRSGYMLSEEQESWSDSMDYFQSREETILRGNIQMDDTTNKMLMYSNFAHHWGDIEKLFMTKEPMIVNYDPEQADTLFMRGDTIILTTYNTNQMSEPMVPIEDVIAEITETTETEETTETTETTATTEETTETIETTEETTETGTGTETETPETVKPTETVATPSPKSPESPMSPPSKDSKDSKDSPKPQNNQHPNRPQGPPNNQSPENSNQQRPQQQQQPKDSTPPVRDTTLTILPDSLAQDTLPPTAKEIKAQLKAEAKAKKAEEKRIKAEEKRLIAEEASKERIRLRAEKLDAQKARAARAAAARKDKINARLIKRGKTTAEAIAMADSLDSLRVVDSLRLLDSLHLADSLAAIMPLEDSTEMEIITVEPDSIYRIIVSFRNTKTLQGTQQSVSDSLSIDSRDSTMHLYIDPYIWNGLNQISSEVMDIYTLDRELHKAVFTGKPIMSSKIDTTYYNQVAGKTITSHFVGGELVRNDVDNNVQTIYFARDEDTGEVTTMVYIESGSATFYIKNQDLEGITYRIQPTYTFYPVALIPETQPMRLEGFVWREDLRPTRQTFDDKVRRPSVRAEKESIPRPEFPIERSLRIDIENYDRDKYWMNRDDVVAPHAEEWLESLGHKSGQPRSEPIK